MGRNNRPGANQDTSMQQIVRFKLKTARYGYDVEVL